MKEYCPDCFDEDSTCDCRDCMLCAEQRQMLKDEGRLDQDQEDE